MRYQLDQPDGSTAVLGTSARVGSIEERNLRWWLQTTAGSAAALTIGVCGTFLYGIYLVRSEPARSCEMNLRHLYIAYRKLNAGERVPERLPAGLRRKLTVRYLVTESDAAYLYGPHRAIGHYGGERLEVLLCRQDPEFTWKLPLALTGETSVQPSYVLVPRDDLLARCPYHMRQVGRDGRVGAFKPR